MNLFSRHNMVKFLILLLSFTTYLVSMTQASLTVERIEGVTTNYGFELFFMGAFAAIGGGAWEFFIWNANTLYFIALILFFTSKGISEFIAIVATILALSFTTTTEILAAENGMMAPVVSLDLGYWLWVISMAILALGAIYYFSRFRAELQNTTL